MQPSAPFLPVISQPNCIVWFPGDSCDQMIQQYQQALAQRQHQDWQDAVTTRFEKQITDQQKQIADQQAQIKTLQFKIQSQTAEALRSEARSQAFLNGIGVIIGTTLAFTVVVGLFRKLARSPSNHSADDLPQQSRAASA